MLLHALASVLATHPILRLLLAPLIALLRDHAARQRATPLQPAAPHAAPRATMIAAASVPRGRTPLACDACRPAVRQRALPSVASRTRTTVAGTAPRAFYPSPAPRRTARPPPASATRSSPRPACRLTPILLRYRNI